VNDVARPDRRALMELEAVLGEIERLRDSGSRTQFDDDGMFRWALHRLWIAAGNEALRYAVALGRPLSAPHMWVDLYRHRNALAHLSLPEIDDDAVWRMTVLRTAGYRAQARALLH